MQKIIFFLVLAGLALHLNAEELKIKAKSFSSDQNKGEAVFTGNVNIIKSSDELNASKVTVYVNKKKKPTKFIAVGNVSFKLKTKDGAQYRGKAGKVIYYSIKKEYEFYKNVHLKQLNDTREILGDEVILNTTDGKAYAKGLKKEPVIMIFNIDEGKK